MHESARLAVKNLSAWRRYLLCLDMLRSKNQLAAVHMISGTWFFRVHVKNLIWTQMLVQK
jgi:hypothetical protein